MKACQILFISIVLLFCQTVFAQTTRSPNSSIKITINGERYVASGIVASEAVKNEVAEKIRARLGNNVDYAQIRIEANANPFRGGWQTEFDESLSKIKSWRTGVLIFGDDQSRPRTNYPPMPQKIAAAKISLLNGRTVSPKDYDNKLLVLFFFTTWATPGFEPADRLNEFYKTVSSRNIEILGIDTDYDDPTEKIEFPKFAKKRNLQFTLGWIEPEAMSAFVEISKLNGIPQAFVFYKGRLRGVFAGGSPRTTNKLKETILEILDEEKGL